MRIRTLSLAFLFAVAVCSARADVIFHGGGYVVGNTGSTLCSASGSGDGSISVGCTASSQTAGGEVSVTGNGNPYSGMIDVGAFAIGPGPYVYARAEGGFELNQGYVLTGGVGLATVNISLNSPMSLSSGPVSCAFAFNGVSQSCGYFGGQFSEQVEYGVPFSIYLNVEAYATAFNGDPQGEDFSYQFTGPGLIPPPIPEPSSALLLLPGLAGVLFAARLRARRLLGRS